MWYIYVVEYDLCAHLWYLSSAAQDLFLVSVDRRTHPEFETDHADKISTIGHGLLDLLDLVL